MPLFGFGLVCCFIMFSRSTMALPSLARTRSTLPRSPRSLPVVTSTWSFFLTFTFISNDLRRQGDDLHEPLLAQLARHRTEDAGADGLAGVVDQDRGVVVAANVAPVLAPLLLGGAHDHRLDHLSLL